jgi:hypothetical protein
LVRTGDIDRLHHCSFEFNPALLAISIGDWNDIYTKQPSSTDWKNNHQRRNRKTVPLRLWQFTVTRFNYTLDSFILTAVRRFIATISLLHYQLGGACPSKRIPYRLVAGVWTLGAFFFVQAYTSTLFTYVVTPNNRPLIDSVYDVINNGDVNLLVRESGFMNILISARKQNFNVLQQHQNN